MKTYDSIVSLGASCGTTMVLRELGLQSISSPFDWTGGDNLPLVVSTIEADFKDWFNREDLVLWNVSHEKGVIHRFYKNLKTGFGFPHEFSNAEPFEENYEKVRDKYARRIARFLSAMQKPQKVLFAYLEISYNPCLSDEALKSLRDRLARKFPAIDIDLLYFYVAPDRKEILERAVSDAITTVGVDYRVFHHGALMHLTEHAALRRYIADHCALRNPPSAEERKAWRLKQREQWLAPFGKNRIVRKFNRKMHEWYCDLEDYLVAQHLLPGDKPMWFNTDGK